MTMQFKCDCCGNVTDVTQWGAEDSSSVSNDGSPPDGFRTMYVVIEEHDGDGGTKTTISEVLHSCGDCNSYMSVDEHIEAVTESNKQSMLQPASATDRPK